MSSLSFVSIPRETAPAALAVSSPLAAFRPGSLRPFLKPDKAEDSPFDWIHSGEHVTFATQYVVKGAAQNRGRSNLQWLLADHLDFEADDRVPSEKMGNGLQASLGDGLRRQYCQAHLRSRDRDVEKVARAMIALHVFLSDFLSVQ